MEISAVETILADRYQFGRVHTDGDITGLGESGRSGFLDASAGAAETVPESAVTPVRVVL